MRPLIYERTFWESHIVTNPDVFEFNGVTSQLIPQFGPVIQQGTERNPSNFNNMEEGIVAAINAANNHARDIILIQIALLKENIVFSPSKVKFAAVPDVVWPESIGQIDFTKGYASTVNTGTDNVSIDNMNVGNFSDYKVGQEVTMHGGRVVDNLADNGVDYGNWTGNSAVFADFGFEITQDGGNDRADLPNVFKKFNQIYGIVIEITESNSTGSLNLVGGASWASVSDIPIGASVGIYPITFISQGSFTVENLRLFVAGGVDGEKIKGKVFIVAEEDISTYGIDYELPFGQSLLEEKENLIIDSLADPVINFTTNIQNTYVDGANIYRSNVVEEMSKFKFGAFETVGTITKDPAETIFTGTASLGKGGFNTHQASDGTVYTTILGTGVGLKVIDQDGNEKCRIDSATIAEGHSSAIDKDNNVLHVFAHNGTTTVWHWIIDLSTASGDIWGDRIVRDSSQTDIDYLSAHVTGNIVVYSVNTRNASHPSNYLVYTHAFTIQTGGLSVVELYAFELSLSQLSTTEWTYHNVSIDGTTVELVAILADSGTNTSNPIYARRDTSLTDQSWTPANWSGESYDSFATVLAENILMKRKENGADVNRIYVALEHNGSILVYYSDNGGSTWSSAINLGTGSNPTITEDASGNVLVVYENGGNVVERTFPDDSEVPNTLTTLITGATNPQTIPKATSFTKVIVSAETSTPNIVIFGQWTGGVSLSLTEVDVRLNIEPPEEFQRIVSWLNYDDEPTFAADALASIVGQTDPESYFDLEDITTDLGATDEVVSGGIGPNLGDKITLKYNLTRGSINDEVLMNYFLGYLVL